MTFRVTSGSGLPRGLPVFFNSTGLTATTPLRLASFVSCWTFVRPTTIDALPFGAVATRLLVRSFFAAAGLPTTVAKTNTFGFFPALTWARSRGWIFSLALSRFVWISGLPRAGGLAAMVAAGATVVITRAASASSAANRFRNLPFIDPPCVRRSLTLRHIAISGSRQRSRHPWGSCPAPCGAASPDAQRSLGRRYYRATMTVNAGPHCDEHPGDGAHHASARLPRHTHESEDPGRWPGSPSACLELVTAPWPSRRPGTRSRHHRR